jgi:hypothetical protein
MHRALWLLALTAAAGSAPASAQDAELTVAAVALGAVLQSQREPSRIAVSSTLGWDNKPAARDLEEWLASDSRRQRLLPLARRFWEANATPRQVTVLEVPGFGRTELTSARPDTVGQYALSRVAFSPHGDSALVATGFSCPGLCGGWDLWLYVRADTTWRRVSNLMSVNH